MSKWWLLWVLAGCGGAQGEPCKVDDDCVRELECACRGVSQDPCRPGMTPQQCDKARCGSRVCVHPAEPPRR